MIDRFLVYEMKDNIPEYVEPILDIDNTRTIK